MMGATGQPASEKSGRKESHGKANRRNVERDTQRCDAAEQQDVLHAGCELERYSSFELQRHRR